MRIITMKNLFIFLLLLLVLSCQTVVRQLSTKYYDKTYEPNFVKMVSYYNNRDKSVSEKLSIHFFALKNENDQRIEPTMLMGFEILSNTAEEKDILYILYHFEDSSFMWYKLSYKDWLGFQQGGMTLTELKDKIEIEMFVPIMSGKETPIDQ